MAYREDIGSLAPARRLDDGRLIADALFTRTGVFAYYNADGSERLEYRSPAEVFKKTSMDSLAMVPFTDEHPPTMVDAKNADHYTVGQVGENIRRDGIHLAGRLVVNQASTIQKMDAGEAELSCGYDCDLKVGPGISPEGERYDAQQLNIIYNHVARVAAGRAGSARARMDARLQRVSRADAAVQVAPSDISPPAAHSAPTSIVIPGRVDGTDKKEAVMDLTQALAALAAANEKIGAATARADAADKKADKNKQERQDAEKALATAEAAVAAEKLRADTAEKKAVDAEKARTDASQNFDARVSARASLISTASIALGRNDKGETLAVDGKSTIKLDSMADRDIRVAVVSKLDGVTIPAERSDDAVGYAFELATARAAKAGQALGSAREVLVSHNLDAKDPAPKDDREMVAKARMDSNRKNAWKTASKTAAVVTDDDKGAE